MTLKCKKTKTYVTGFGTGQQTEGRKILKRTLVKVGKNEKNFTGNRRKENSIDVLVG